MDDETTTKKRKREKNADRFLARHEAADIVGGRV
jgi:hypothetical protein